MSDYVYESGLSTKRRRQRRTAITLVLTLLLLFSAFWWAWSYIRTGEPSAVPATPASTIAPGACIDAKAVTINIYNATNRTGLARLSANALVDAGFTVGKVANWPEEGGVQSFGTIRFGPAVEEAATGFVEHYGQPLLLRPLEREGMEIDIVLGDSFTGWAPFPETPPC